MKAVSLALGAMAAVESARALDGPYKMRAVSAALGALVVAQGVQGLDDAPRVTTTNGTVTGFISDSYEQDLFLGIPYAQPPLGPLRFATPQSLNTTYNGTLNATAYSPSCVGYGGDDIGYSTSEDCLTLNVVRPSTFNYDQEKLPVAVWIHGGGFVMGGSQDRRYNLSFIVGNGKNIGKPFIAVSLNYRLSAWGFLGSRELAAEGATNVGLLDQRLALHWIQENIAAFGGDPNQVTIWGESAGASSVGSHLIAYGGRDDGLFHSGVMESGGPITFSATNTTVGLQPLYDTFVDLANCSNATSTLSCLREAPFENLDAIFASDASPPSYNPYIDGDFIQGPPSAALTAGQFVRVPIITGTNTDEGTSPGPAPVDTTADFVAYIEAGGVPANCTPTILALYPDDPCFGVPVEVGCEVFGPAYGAQYRRSAAYFGDVEFLAQRRLAAQAWARYNTSVYSYRFNVLPHGIPAETGVTHFQEVAFVFYNLDGLGYDDAHGTVNPFEDEPGTYEQVSRLMSYAWASFFVDQNPNSWRDGPAGTEMPAVGPWPRYGGGNGTNFVFDANVTSHTEVDDYRYGGMKFINDHAADVYGR